MLAISTRLHLIWKHYSISKKSYDGFHLVPDERLSNLLTTLIGSFESQDLPTQDKALSMFDSIINLFRKDPCVLFRPTASRLVEPYVRVSFGFFLKQRFSAPVARQQQEDLDKQNLWEALEGYYEGFRSHACNCCEKEPDCSVLRCLARLRPDHPLLWWIMIFYEGHERGGLEKELANSRLRRGIRGASHALPEKCRSGE